MAHKLDIIKGTDQGSIKIGATGRVSALMVRELDDSVVKHYSSTNSSVSHKRNPVCCGVSTRRASSSNSASTRSSSMGSTDQRTRGIIQQKIHKTTAYRIPMLVSEDISIDRIPGRDRLQKKRSQLVEIVDLKCGINPEKAWFRPISNTVNKLTFSRISVSN